MNESERAFSALQSLDPGTDRQTWVRIGMAAKAADLSLDQFTDWSSNAGNFSGARDCATAWRSFNDGGITAATLFGMARDAGWSDPGKAEFKRSAALVRHNDSPVAKVTSSSDMSRQHGNEGPAAFWEHCIPAAGSHPYIVAKGGSPEGLRMVPHDDQTVIAGQRVAGSLVLPALSLSGVIRTAQIIPPPDEGKKKVNLPGASFGDGLFIVGDAEKSDRLIITESIGNAWACRRATGHASVVCFGAGRMQAVADAIHKQYPAKRLVVVPDRGKESQAQDIAKKVSGAWVEMPDNKPSNYDANDYAADYGDDALKIMLAYPKMPAMRYRPLSAADVMDAPPLQYLVRNVLPAHGLGCMYGASGGGKSFLSLDLAVSVADGAPWFGYKVTQAPVIYVALEGEAGFRQRLKAAAMQRGRPLPDALRFVLQPLDLREKLDIVELADAIAASGCAGGLLIIDTLNRAACGADENSSADMGQIIDAAKCLQQMFGGLVMLVHHTGKDAAKGMRGHSSLYAALDAAVEVVRDVDHREWRIAKSKDGSDDAGCAFRLKVFEVGQHDDGDPITSCAVVPADADEIAPKTKRMKLGSTQELVHAALSELLTASGKYGQGGAPASRPCVEYEPAILFAGERLSCRPDQRGFQVRRAVEAMAAGGLYALGGGWIWQA